MVADTPGSSLRNVALLSAAPAVSVIAGLLAAKCWARLLGPGGLGALALMQTFATFGALVAGAGIATAFMKSAAQARAHGEIARVAALNRASRVTTWTISLFVAALVVAFRGPVSERLFQSQVGAASVAVVAIAIIFTVQSSLAGAELALFRPISVLARVNASTVIVSTLVLIAVVFFWRRDGIAAGLALGTAAGFAIAAGAARKGRKTATERIPVPEVVASSKELLSIGIPYMASAMIGSAVLVILPLLVLHALGTENVGYYRAGTICSAYLELFLAAASQEFLPRIAAQSRNPDVPAVAEQTTLLVSALLPVIVVVFALGDFVIPLVYSRSFLPAVPLLQWELIGDVIKVFTFPMSFAVLTLRGSHTYLAARTLSAVVTVVVTMATLEMLGLRAPGIAYVAGQVVYAIILLAVLRRKGGRTLIPHLLLVSSTVAVMVGIQISTVDGSAVRYVLSLSLAMVLTVIGAARLRPLLRLSFGSGKSE